MSKRRIRRRRIGDNRITSEPWAELGARLRPLEEKEGQKATSGPLEGAIRVDETRVPVPNGIVESDSQHRWGLETVVIIIAGLMLAFIAFIAWQVSLMSGPAKP